MNEFSTQRENSLQHVKITPALKVQTSYQFLLCIFTIKNREKI